MAIKRTVKAPPAPTTPPPRAVIPAGAEERGASLLAPLQPDVVGLSVVDAQSYELADLYLNKVQTARKKWRAEMYGTDEKSGPIPSIRQGLDALYALNRKIDSPLEGLETLLKKKMKDFKEEEARQLREAEQRRLAKVQRLQQIENENLRKAAEAATPQLRGRFESIARNAATATEVIEETPVAQPVQAFNSATRMRKKWRLRDRTAFAKACLDNTLGVEWLDVSEEGKATLNELLKSDPDSLGAYPGIEVYEEISIVGR